MTDRQFLTNFMHINLSVIHDSKESALSYYFTQISAKVSFRNSTNGKKVCNDKTYFNVKCYRHIVHSV